MFGWGKDKKSDKGKKSAQEESRPVHPAEGSDAGKQQPAPQAPQRPRRTTGTSRPAQRPAAPSKPGSLEELLIEEGKVSQEQLDKAVAKQKETGAFLGQILVDMGIIDENSLTSFLAKYCKIPHLSLLDYLIDETQLELVPKEVCLKYRLIPIDKLGKNLTVAMVNPLDQEALEVVKSLCPDLRIKPILCAWNHYESVTARLFGEQEGDAKRPMFGSDKYRLGAKATTVQAPAESKDESPQQPEPEPEAPAVDAEPEPIQEPEPEQEAVPAQSQDEQVRPGAEHERVEPRTLAEFPEPEPEPEPQPADETAQAGEQAALETAPPADNGEVAAEQPTEPAAAAREQEELDDDAVLGEVFREEEPAEQVSKKPVRKPPTADAGSGIMEEMISVMRDSMRDTYAMLARRMELFRGLSPEFVAKIFAKGMTLEFEKGQTIFQKGDEGKELYVILGGRVDIVDGERKIATLSRGDMFGEMGLISNEPRSASAVALNTTSVLVLTFDVFEKILPKDVAIQLLINIVVTLSERLRQANDLINADTD